MQRFNFLSILIAQALAILFLTSCTKSCSDKTSLQDSTIKIAVSDSFEALDPRYATSALASRLANLIYAPLFVMGKNLYPKPFLAKSIEAQDEKTFKVTLRNDLKFHDGSELSAQDVVYTFSQLGSNDVGSPHAAKFDYIESITAKNKHEIIFELKQPHAPFLTDLVPIGIVSKKACLNRSQECRHEYLGSGPYKVAKWNTAKDSLHLVPFKKWFEGAPKQELLFRTVRDENTRMLELIGKKTDIVDSDISPQNSIELKKHSYLQVSEVPGLGYNYMAINVRPPTADDKKSGERFKTKSALSNKTVRMAIAQAIDFDQIISKVMLGSAIRVSGLVPNSHWAKDENLAPPPFDPKNAEVLLDKAGFKRQGEKNTRFKLVISTTPNRLRQNIAMLYADFLKRVGIDVSVRVKEWGALYQDMKQGQFEIFSAIWVPVTEPDLYYWVHHSASIPNEEVAGGNRHGYKNPEVDRLIAMGRTTMDSVKRKLIYQEIERIMLEDLPYIPLWNENRIVVVNSERVQGFEPMSTGSFINLRKARITLNAKSKASH